jgi:hypothetical protein
VRVGKTEGYARDKDDFFPTPDECTLALLRAEKECMPVEIWEPACGEGAICKMMPARMWIATDLVARGYGQSGVDFLMERKKLADAIITNPPFKNLTAFIDKAIDLDVSYIAMFFRVTYLCTGAWQRICEKRAPARIYTLSWRPDIFGIGTPDQRCLFIWAVWDKRYEGETIYRTLRRPK